MEKEAVSSYLCSKFSSILEEAEKDPNIPSQIISRFRSIDNRISSTDSSSSIPIDLLYELIESLSECRIFSHQRHRPRSWASLGPPLTHFLFKRKMLDRLNDIHMKLQSTPPSSTPITTQRTYPIVDASEILGFESEAEEIEGWLMADNYSKFTAVGILGQRSGCGKTALAQKVFASTRIQDEFSPRIWVCLSNMLFDTGRIRFLTSILEKIGQSVSELEDGDFSAVKLLEKLKSELMGKRYLIVLDDAWREDGWFGDLGYRQPRGDPMGEFFSHGLPKGSGGAVIVTSQLESVIKGMVGDQHVIRLESRLSDERCWNIFCAIVRHQGKVDPDHPKLQQLKEDVVRKCDGLPLAAKILADTIPNLLLSTVL